MRHSRAGVLMSLYLDEQLDASRTRQLERHLVSCSECRRDLARLRLAEPALRESDPAARTSVPPDLERRIMRRVAAYEAQQAADLARARLRREIRHARRVAFWRGPGWRMVVVTLALIAAVIVWWRTYPSNELAGAAEHLAPNALQLLATPGPSGIAWSVWIALVALALVVGGWLARAEISAEWRRALVERLPQLW